MEVFAHVADGSGKQTMEMQSRFTVAEAWCGVLRMLAM
jgi:hypothetical protein